MQTKETLTITRIYTTDKKQDGSPLISKKGTPYTRMSILTQEYGDKVWLGGFKNKTTEQFKVGDKVELLVGKTNTNGKEYINFDVPKMDKADESLNRQMEIIILLRQIAEKVGVQTYLSTPEKKADTVDYPDDEINADDIPF